MQPYRFTPIGTVRSCFKEKFGIPRQPGLAPEATASIVLPGTQENKDAVRGLAEFSHLWVVFVFHESVQEGWKPLVRPPRLGGSEKVGVFASRSPHRPNPVGLSVVRLEKVEIVSRANKPEIHLHLRGADLLEGTPVLDLKPYIPYADSIPRARAGWAQERPKPLKIAFSPAARSRCRELEAGGYPKFSRLIRQVLSLDPRPNSQKSWRNAYATRLYDFDVDWEITDGTCRVIAIRHQAKPIAPGRPS